MGDIVYFLPVLSCETFLMRFLDLGESLELRESLSSSLISIVRPRVFCFILGLTACSGLLLVDAEAVKKLRISSHVLFLLARSAECKYNHAGGICSGS